jgi:hypothetical protein
MNRPSLVNIKSTSKTISNSNEIRGIYNSKILNKDDIIKKNSIALNTISILIIIGVFYFLYIIYLERKSELDSPF